MMKPKAFQSFTNVVQFVDVHKDLKNGIFFVWHHYRIRGDLGWRFLTCVGFFLDRQKLILC